MRRSDRQALDRWVEAGLIGPEQRMAILAAEAVPPTAVREPVSSKRSVFAEIVGSLGAIAAVVAAVVGVGQVWSDLEPWARVALPLMGGVVLLGASLAIPASADRGLARLGALLALLGIAGFVTAVVVLTLDVWEWDGQNALLAAGVVALVVALLVVRVRREPHLVLAVAAGVYFVAIGLVQQYDHVRVEQVGAVVLACSLAIALAGWGALVPSPATTYLVGAGGSIVGAMMIGDWSVPTSIAICAVVAALFLVGFALDRHRTLLLGGLALAIAAIVRGVVELTEERGAGRPRGTAMVAGVFVAGVVLLAVAVWAVRRPGQHGPPAGGEDPDRAADEVADEVEVHGTGGVG